MYVRDDMADMRVSIDGLPYFGDWATFSGGDMTAADAKTRPGGMGREVSTGGPTTRNDGTATIQWSDTVLAKFKKIESLCGTARIAITLNWMGKNRRPLPGAVYTRVGTLKGVSDPNFDHNGNAVGFMTLVFSLDELAA